MEIRNILFFDEQNIEEFRSLEDKERTTFYEFREFDSGKICQNLTIHVWRFSLKNQELMEFSKQFLSEEENRKVLRLKMKNDQAAYQIGHGMLRFLLSNGDAKCARSLEIAQGEHGKPFLKEAEISFNISHAGSYVAIAFVKGCEIGVDLEQVRMHKWSESFLKKVFHEKEYEEYLAAEQFDEERFFLKWTQKEAVVKAMGDGLTKELSAFYLEKVEDFNQEIARYSVVQKKYQEDSSSWQVFSVSLDQNYYLSIAII